MQPIKDKSLHYFILEDNSNEFSYSTVGFHEKQAILSGLKRDQLYGIIDFFRPHDIHHLFEDGRLSQKNISPQHFKVPFKVKYMEEVINIRGYQHSVEFTIGSSKRSKESKKYLIGIELHLESLDVQINMIKQTCPWYDIGFKDLGEIGVIEGYRRHMSFDSKERYTFSFPTIRLDAKILAHAGNTKDVCDFSYDDLYKYYTLLCS